MSKKRRKKKTKGSTPGAPEQEAFDALAVRELRAKISLLKRVPKDFRDIVPYSPDWRALAKVMGPEAEAEMTTWARGGVLTLAPINAMEKEVLNNVVDGCVEIETMEDLSGLLDDLGSVLLAHISFIYAPQFSSQAIKGLNWLCSHFGETYRFRGQLLGSDGKALGVVY